MEETKGLKEEFEKDREELEAKLELLDKMYHLPTQRFWMIALVLPLLW
eukprot:COSAG05_NODE_42_length_26187_cov_393.972286_18_plen_48_part_00